MPGLTKTPNNKEEQNKNQNSLEPHASKLIHYKIDLTEVSELTQCIKEVVPGKYSRQAIFNLLNAILVPVYKE